MNDAVGKTRLDNSVRTQIVMLLVKLASELLYTGFSSTIRCSKFRFAVSPDFEFDELSTTSLKEEGRKRLVIENSCRKRNPQRKLQSC